MPISFKIVKSKNLLTFKAEVNRFRRIWRRGEEKGRFPGKQSQKPADHPTKPPALTFGNIGVFYHKKAAFAGGHFVKNDFQNLNGGASFRTSNFFSTTLLQRSRRTFRRHLG
ncbi:hypothetical protein [Candidatus Magnetaquicoccus inordinatus]|uniref:hypothetical protein n=1 Tax=Candidatus Magnetaquicoccus inordinatus TaxID=2496818 RepID=UPI00102BE3E9|nr:hypothetical protein [Candidatus Magnetaquicoccus inordinatus]